MLYLSLSHGGRSRSNAHQCRLAPRAQVRRRSAVLPYTYPLSRLTPELTHMS